MVRADSMAYAVNAQEGGAGATGEASAAAAHSDGFLSSICHARNSPFPFCIS
ncbi:MAG: hypothetical protein FWE30_05380 [Bacteroidales bacterium]|nr:hypothetical protein [Bacteroidales bacterium]